MAVYVGTRNETLYGRQSRETIDYLAEKAESSMRKWSSRAKETYKRSRESFIKSIDLEDLERKIRAGGRNLRSKLRQDEIRKLHDIIDLQIPPTRMVRYLAANVKTRQLMQKNLCDGWSDRYIDYEPDKIGLDHYDYRHLTHGVYMPNADGSMSATSFFERDRDTLDRLNRQDRVEIMLAHQLLESHLIPGGDDPTSRFNSKL